jgi:hypothetical protein
VYLLQTLTLKASIPLYTPLQSYNPLLTKFPHGHKCALVVFAVNGGMITLSAACIRTLRRMTYVFELSITCRSLTNLILFSKETKKPRHNILREKHFEFRWEYL